jgi:signal transduction histidine kinase
VQDAIASLIEEMWLSECNVEWKVLGEPVPVDGKIALALYRAAQEGLTNVRKHANATLVDVLLDFLQPDQLQLTIWDNGVGAADTSGGFGLIGIRERVHLLGGECRIESQPGKGFRLEVSLPLREGERV